MDCQSETAGGNFLRAEAAGQANKKKVKSDNQIPLRDYPEVTHFSYFYLTIPIVIVRFHEAFLQLGKY